MQIQCGRFEQTINVPKSSPEDHDIRLRLRKGTRKFTISFLNDYYKNGKDRNLKLHHLHLHGEEKRSIFTRPKELPASHKKLIFVKPNDRIDGNKATATVINRLASRAFRRPATPGERND